MVIITFIRSKKVVNSRASDVPELSGFGEVAWNFISSIYKSGWDLLSTDKYINLFKSKVVNKFTLKAPKFNSALTSDESKGKAVKIIRLPFPIPAHLFKKVLEKSKFFEKRKNIIAKAKTNMRQSYA